VSALVPVQRALAQLALALGLAQRAPVFVPRLRQEAVPALARARSRPACSEVWWKGYFLVDL